MTAKTNTQRQKEHKARMKEAGFVRLEVWVHPDDKSELKRFAQFLRSKRLTCPVDVQQSAYTNAS